MNLVQYENDACWVAMQLAAKSTGGQYNAVTFFKSLLPDSMYLRVTRSHDHVTREAFLWHLSASVGVGSHGTLSIRRPSDAEMQAVIDQLGRPDDSEVLWAEERFEGQAPNVRRFWEQQKT